MGWFILVHVFTTWLSIFGLGRLSEEEKDLEILVLRHQLAILERQQEKRVMPSRIEKLTLAVLAVRLKQIGKRTTRQLRDIIRILEPETVIGWHRELVGRKWTYQHRSRRGRPALDKELEDLILRLAHENPRWGYGKLEGELLKLGYEASQTTIRNVLHQHRILPAGVRGGSIGWRQLMKHYKEQILACDFFTVETLRLQTLYVFFFIEVGSRRVHFAGITDHPNDFWVTQQARQLIWKLEGRESLLHFLIHDNDRKFTRRFDTVFASEGYHVIHTPFEAPNANAYAERWVRTVREECLDPILVLNAAHLRRVLLEYIDQYYNVARPHQGIEQQIPLPRGRPTRTGVIRRRQLLGGILNDYYRASGSFSLVTN